MAAVQAQAAIPPAVAQLQDVHLHYGTTHALRGITLTIPAGCMV